MKRAKISIIGAGNVGAAAAHLCALKELGDIVLVDIAPGIPQGKALDISQAMPVEGSNIKIIGSNDYDDTKNSDIVVITAGLPRKSDMSRDDLLKKNTEIVQSVTEAVVKNSQNSILIVVSNPLDAMVYTAFKVSGFPKNKVIGMAGILDSTRFRYFVADKLGVSVESVNALVLGGHGDQMIPLVNHADVSGVPLTQLLDKSKIDEIVDRTRNGGAEFIPLLKTSAYYAPGSAIAEMVESIVKDKKKILPCAAYLEGEYGETDLFIGVPIKLGKNGVEEIIEIELDESEKKAFRANAEHVRELCKKTGL